MAIAAPAPRVIADVVPRAWARQGALVVGYAALTALTAQVAFYLPWNPAVPFTLQTFAVVLGAAALGSWRSTTGMLLYAAVGSLGAPVFAQGSSGFGGPTFGYVVGFVVAAFVVGKVAESGHTRAVVRTLGLMILGNAIIYAVGVTWLKYSLDVSWFGTESAWAYGARDFIVGDLLKIAVAAGLLPLTWRFIARADGD